MGAHADQGCLRALRSMMVSHERHRSLATARSRTVCPTRGVRQLDDSTMNGMWQSLKPAS